MLYLYTCTYPCTMVLYVRTDDRPWNPQTRTTTETVLREAMQALVRVQAQMLARIVVEILNCSIP